MEHPLISNIDHLTIDELQVSINDLTKKLIFAQKIGNGSLANQLRMALETYNNKYQEKIQAMYKGKNNSDTDYSDRIDIS